VTTQPNNKCDQDTYENGRTVCVLAGASTAIEAVVVRAREELQVSLDWHYSGGRANVLTTAPPELDGRIRERIRCAMPVWLAPNEEPAAEASEAGGGEE